MTRPEPDRGSALRFPDHELVARIASTSARGRA